MLPPKTKGKYLGRNPNAKFYVCINSNNEKRSSNNFTVDDNNKTIFVASSAKLTLEPTYWQFNTDKVFDDAGQEEIFSQTIEPIVEFAFSGIDITVIVFGEPGTGKTFKMSGLTKSYANRGLIPRTIQALGLATQNRIDEFDVTIGITYVEFSQNKCYDLLKKQIKTKLNDVELVYIKSPNDALKLLFRGEARRKLEKLSTHCSTSVFTVHLKLTTVSQMDSSVYNSKIHFVEMSGFENVQLPVKSLPCSISSNLDKLSIDWASRWTFDALTKNNVKKLPKAWHLTDYLGDSFSMGIIILIGLVKRENLQSTLSALRFGSKVARLHIGELRTSKKPSPTRKRSELSIKVKLLKEELEMRQTMKFGNYQRWNISQTEAHHIERMIKAYLTHSRPDRNVEASMLSTASPGLLFEEIKRQCQCEFNKILAAYSLGLAVQKQEMPGEDFVEIVKPKRSQGRIKKSQSVSSPHSQMTEFPSGKESQSSEKAGVGEGRKSLKIRGNNGKRKSRSGSSRKSIVSKKTKDKTKHDLSTKDDKLPEIPEEFLEKGRKDKQWFLQEFLARRKDLFEEKKKTETDYFSKKEAKLLKMFEVDEIRANLGNVRIKLSDARWNRRNVGRNIFKSLDQPLSDIEKSLIDEDKDILTKFNTVKNELASNHCAFITAKQTLNNFQTKLEKEFGDYCSKLLGETVQPIYASTFDKEITRPSSLLFVPKLQDTN